MTSVLEGMARGAPPWRHLLIRQGRCEAAPGALRLIVEEASARGLAYSDAQIDDYQAGPGPRFIRCPPLRLRVRARFSRPEGGLRGTAGFGFWNYPIAWPLRLPRAIWFFYASPPNDMPRARIFAVWIWFFGPRFRRAIVLGLPVRSLTIWATCSSAM